MPVSCGGFEIELIGDLASMIQLCLSNTRGGPHANAATGHDLIARSVKLVAGTRNHLDLLLSC
jgi:hypothetical protein